MEKRFSDFKLGDKVIFLVHNNELVISEENCIVKTDHYSKDEVYVIGCKPSVYLLGWKTEEYNSWEIDDYAIKECFDKVDDFDDYKYGFWAYDDEIFIIGKIEKYTSSDGCVCKVCQIPYPYAIPNQKDGTLICYSCRSGLVTVFT